MLLCAIFNLIFNLAKYCDQLVCLSVWLLAYIKKTHLQISPTFPCTFLVAVARFFSDGNVGNELYTFDFVDDITTAEVTTGMWRMFKVVHQVYKGEI